MAISVRHHSSACELMLCGQVLTPEGKVAEPEGRGDLVGGWLWWSGAALVKPLLALHSSLSVVLSEIFVVLKTRHRWPRRFTECLLHLKCWPLCEGSRRKLWSFPLRKQKSSSHAHGFPFHLFHTPPLAHTHRSTTVIQGDKVDIVPHTVVLYTELLGTIKIKFLPLTSLDTKARKRVLKSSAFKTVFTEQEMDNKGRRLFTSKMLFSCSHFTAFVKTNASNFFTRDVQTHLTTAHFGATAH